MRLDDCYQLGYVVKTHGIKGEVTIKFDVDFPEDYSNLESILIDKNGLIPFFIEVIRAQDDKAIIKFKDIDSLDKAKELTSCSLYLPLDQLPPMPEGAYYYHDLLNCKLYSNNEFIGVISNVYQPSHQYIAAVEHKGTEILIPVTEEIFRKVDIANHRVDADLPDGLLDIYTDPQK